MELSAVPAAAKGAHVAVASLADSLELQGARIREYVEVQRRKLAAIQAELTTQIDQLTRLGHDEAVAELSRALDQSREECQKLRAAAEEGAQVTQLRSELEQLRHDAQRLVEENQRLRHELSQAPASGGINEAGGDAQLRQDLEDLQRRYQMALDDLKSERAQVAELEAKLSRAGSGGSAAVGDAKGTDWESQKRRLLAALEADFSGEGEQERRDRMTVEEAIRHTEAAVAAKDREIAELQSLLEEKNSNVSSMAVSAAAVAEVLDKDEIVRQERQNLQALQDEWREKLRQAEVEISVQRAKLARQQAEIEERSRQLDQQSRGAQLEESAERKEAKEKPARGRWLRRLGLSGGDEG